MNLNDNVHCCVIGCHGKSVVRDFLLGGGLKYFETSISL